MSLELLPMGALTTAGTMGLAADGELVLEPCWGRLGDSGSTLTRAGAEARQTDGDKTTTRARKAELLQRAAKAKHRELS